MSTCKHLLARCQLRLFSVLTWSTRLAPAGKSCLFTKTWGGGDNPVYIWCAHLRKRVCGLTGTIQNHQPVVAHPGYSQTYMHIIHTYMYKMITPLQFLSGQKSSRSVATITRRLSRKERPASLAIVGRLKPPHRASGSNAREFRLHGQDNKSSGFCYTYTTCQ